MKLYNLTKLILSGLIIFAIALSCSKDEGGGATLTEDTGIIPPRFDDSWGYLEAYAISFPLNSNVTEEEIDYGYSSLVADAFFLPSAGSDKFDPDGGGNVFLNNTALTNILGSYWGGSSIFDKAEWIVNGNSKVMAFEDSCNKFIPITGLTIPSWTACNPNEDLTISIKGNTAEAYSLFVECISNPQLTYGDDKFLTKKIEPGTSSVTITSSELKELQKYYNLGFTLAVEAYLYKKAIAGGKSYYMNNGTRITHAVYFNQE